MTWPKPPPPEMEEYYKRVTFVEAEEAGGWTELMEGAGLKEVVGSASKFDMSAESKGRIERYGWWEIVKVMLKMVALSVRDRRSRQFLKDGMGGLSKEMFEVMGYGVFVGRKV